MNEATAQKPPHPPAAPPPFPPMVHVREEAVWEYRRIARNLSKEGPPTEADLNGLGKDGWELAAVFTDSPFAYFYLKRPAAR